jgi:hypothetical protein
MSRWEAVTLSSQRRALRGLNVINNEAAVGWESRSESADVARVGDNSTAPDVSSCRSDFKLLSSQHQGIQLCKRSAALASVVERIERGQL